MPVKRRRGKRRFNTDPDAERRAWAMLFRCGYDYLGDIGISAYRYDWQKNSRLVATARNAWQRLGGEFMRRRPADARPPWAFNAFGEPPCR